ncbi:MAG TPA: alpha-glucan family phosphorylase [Gemmatimonadaceae bacterium]|nr:alpha-glucan family phosphorylase [Gemmatimonadaceae bacterium]
MADSLGDRELPQELESLRSLALDLRWTWSHGADGLWRALAPELWRETENPWLVLQQVSSARLAAMAADASFVRELAGLEDDRRKHLAASGWYSTIPDPRPRGIAYFCMEFGLAEALPLYAGGLGVLAGDYLKAASDLGVPAVGVGLLYQEGYFRQMLDTDGKQRETYPFTDPISLPLRPVRGADGAWLHVTIDFPGRALRLRVWRAEVGRVPLYLLDSNTPTNSPVDRGITGRLYDAAEERRLMQQIVLGIGGWRLLDMLGATIDVCHLNEGHAAFALLERARTHMVRHHTGFREALWATRAGNVFTTHTAVSAAFDQYGPALIRAMMPYVRLYADGLGITAEELLGLGRAHARDESEPFNMALLALRGSAVTNGVSALHGEVSRRLFAGMYPRWPAPEVPVTHVTNGVHVPSWDSPQADAMWERHCGKPRWLDAADALGDRIAGATDEELWQMREENRRAMVEVVRARLALQRGFMGSDEEEIERAGHVLDPFALTLGFARRFAEYKRPALLLDDPERLVRLLRDPERPVQLVLAGKAHPRDTTGKAILHRWVEFARRPDVRDHVVFLADYDLTLAQELVRGVDVWINTPRRPWEACGTSGMKVLASGGLNCSTLDGWWAEAYDESLGWAVRTSDGDDRADAEHLYTLLEREIIPEFHARDARGVPTRWIARVRASMAILAPRFSTNRMMREYIEQLYRPAAARVLSRTAGGGRAAAALADWHVRLEAGWDEVHFGAPEIAHGAEGWTYAIAVHLGRVLPEDVRVELYANADDSHLVSAVEMRRDGGAGDGAGVFVYRASVAERPPTDFTPRVFAAHPGAVVPAEMPVIRWLR